MKATEQYFPVVLFIMLYKAVLTFDFGDLKAVEQLFLWYFLLHSQGGSSFSVCG